MHASYPTTSAKTTRLSPAVRALVGAALHRCRRCTSGHKWRAYEDLKRDLRSIGRDEYEAALRAFTRGAGL